MKKISVKDIVSAVNGIFYGDKNILENYVCRVNTDSRKIVHDSLFIPLAGEKFDAHDFIEQAFANGAICTLSEKILDTQKNFIKVDSTYQALLDLAEYYRNLLDVKIVAVTGSCGKTTTKDIIASVLSQKYNFSKSRGNFNNHVGLPLTIFEMDSDTQIAVLEMGTNHFGEINVLSKVARPDVCVITNIGLAHIENFVSQEGILKAKSEIFNYANDNFLAVLNGDDKYLRKLNLKNKIYCGLDDSNNIFAYDIKGQTFSVNVLPRQINLNYPGEFMIKNSLIAIAIGKYFDVPDEKIIFGVENFQLSNMRMEFLHAKNNLTIINDVYNASPTSMKSAIDVLDSINAENKICILGDMFELGENSPKFHFDIGNYLSTKKINLVICIGDLAKNIFDGINSIEKKYYKTKEEFFYAKNNFANATVLIKASRGMHFEEIVNKLMR